MKKFDVLAIGELNVDMVMTGLESPPVIGREIIAKDCSIVMGSSTAICACGIAKLGLKTGFVGKLGKDNFGEVVLQSLKDYGISLEYIQMDENIKTGITVSLSTKKDRALVTYLGSIDALSLEDIDLNLIGEIRHIHIGSYFLQSRLRPGIPELFAYAKGLGVTTSLDSGWDDTQNWDYGIFDALKYTDIFFPNEIEAIHITKKSSAEEALDVLAGYCSMAVVKCGPKGAIAQNGRVTIKKPAFNLKPVDTTGAGDSFNAGFIYAYLKGGKVDECLDYGNACGSISITRVGGASSCASVEEVERLIKKGVI
jgi:sugar/nucleoside kinase (ribokinase family)